MSESCELKPDAERAAGIVPGDTIGTYQAFYVTNLATGNGFVYGIMSATEARAWLRLHPGRCRFLKV